MLGNRNSQHSFAQVPSVNHPTSTFNRSFGIKDTFDFDDLVPFFLDEMLPGDTAHVSYQHFTRLATQIVPIMDNMKIDFFFFFVPNRLVYDKWRQLNGEQINPGDSTDFIMPQMTAPNAGFAINSLADHFGLPTGVGKYVINNCLPFRCYNLIYNEWFRDQNLQSSLDVPKDEGPDLPTEYSLQKSGKAHDYFTSSLPWPQKGPAVSFPLGTSAPIVADGTILRNSAPVGNRYPGEPTFGRQLYIPGVSSSVVSVNGTIPGAPSPVEQAAAVEYDSDNIAATLTADLSAATAGTINMLREAFAMQTLFENDARGGTRYTEIIRMHFGVISPDQRLQRPEYLGGGNSAVICHPVAQTASTNEDTPQANLASFGTSSETGNRIGFTKSFTEHGYVIGLMRCRGAITYQQGLNRLWSRSTRYDFYWPEFNGLGEQIVRNDEIYVQDPTTVVLPGKNNADPFGYQERFAEMRYRPSEIRGAFRSTAPASLDVWHLAEEFSALPALNGVFIQSQTPIERCIAVTDEPHLLMDGWFDYKHTRPLPVRNIPAKIGGF